MSLTYLAIQVTRPLKEIQIEKEALPPNTLQQSMEQRPSIVLTCLICQKGWTGKSQYASAISNLKSMRCSLPDA